MYDFNVSFCFLCYKNPEYAFQGCSGVWPQSVRDQIFLHFLHFLVLMQLCQNIMNHELDFFALFRFLLLRYQHIAIAPDVTYTRLRYQIFEKFWKLLKIANRNSAKSIKPWNRTDHSKSSNSPSLFARNKLLELFAVRAVCQILKFLLLRLFGVRWTLH